MRKSPRFGLLDSESDDSAYLPVVPENPLPWDLRALPSLAISRYTGMNPGDAPLKWFAAGSTLKETSASALHSALFEPLEALPGTTKLSAM